MLLPLVKIFDSSSGGQDAATSPLGERLDILTYGRRQTDEHSVRLLVLRRVEPRMDLGRQKRGGRSHTVFDLCQVRSGNP